MIILISRCSHSFIQQASKNFNSCLCFFNLWLLFQLCVFFIFQCTFTLTLQFSYNYFISLHDFLNTYYISSGTVPDTIKKYKFGQVLTSYTGNKTCVTLGIHNSLIWVNNLYLVILKGSWFIVLGFSPQVYYLPSISFILHYKGLRHKDFSINFFFLFFHFPQDGDRWVERN